MARNIPRRSPSTKIVALGQKVANRMLKSELDTLDSRYEHQSRAFNHEILLYLANTGHWRQQRNHNVATISRMFAADIDESEVTSRTPTSVVHTQQQQKVEKKEEEEEEEEQQEESGTDSELSVKTFSTVESPIKPYASSEIPRRNRALSVDLLQKPEFHHHRRKSAPEVIITPALSMRNNLRSDKKDSFLEMVAEQSEMIEGRLSPSGSISGISITGDNITAQDRLSPSSIISGVEPSRRESVSRSRLSSRLSSRRPSSARSSRRPNIPLSEIASPLEDARYLYIELSNLIYLLSMIYKRR